MERLEVSLKILEQLLLLEKGKEPQDLLVVTERTLQAFERIYIKIAQLELVTLIDLKKRIFQKQFVVTLKEASNNDSYEEFRRFVADALSEKPELLDCSDCSEKTTELFKEGFASSTFQEMKTTFEKDQITCDGIGCPYRSYQEIVKDSNDYDQSFREQLRNLTD